MQGTSCEHAPHNAREMAEVVLKLSASGHQGGPITAHAVVSRSYREADVAWAALLREGESQK